MPISITSGDPRRRLRRATLLLGALGSLLAAIALLLGPGATGALTATATATEPLVEETEKAEETAHAARRTRHGRRRVPAWTRRPRRPVRGLPGRYRRPRSQRPADVLATPHLTLRGPPRHLTD